MADDIRLVINVENKGVLAAIKSTETLEGKVRKLSDTYKRGGITSGKYQRALRDLAAASNKSKKELQDYASALRAAEREAKKETEARKAATAAAKLEAQARKAAAEQAKVEAQARRAAAQAVREAAAEQRKAAQAAAQAAAQEARAARSTADANRRLRMEFREGYAARVALRAAQMRLSQAHRQGIIDAEEYQRQLQRLGQAAQQGGRHMSRSAVLTQQFGYQAGDFLVQVQGGTNAMVAFGQQATQLVGALYMLPAATLAGRVGLMGLTVSVGTLIAAAGILIPLATAIGAAWMRTRRPAEEVKTTFEGVKDALDKVEEVDFSNLGKEFLETAKEIREEFNDILGIIEDVARSKLEESLKAPLKAVIAELESFEVKAAIAAQLGANEPTFGGQFGLESRNQALFLATQLARLDGETKEELQGQLEAVTETLFLRGILTDEVKETLVQLADELSLMESISGKVNQSKDYMGGLSDATDSVYKSMDAAVTETQKLRDKMFDAWQRGDDLSKLSVKDGVNAAAMAATELAKQLGISLATAQGIVNLGKEGRTGVSGPDAAISGVRSQYGGQATTGVAGVLEQDIVSRVSIAGKDAATGTTGGGVGDQNDSRLQSFLASLQTEQEALETWYSTQQDLLTQFNETELSIIGGQAEARLRVEQEYLDRLSKIQAQERRVRLSETSSMFGALASIAATGGKKLLKTQAVLSAAATTIAAYETAVKAAAEAKTIPGRIAAYASFLATGLAAVGQIKSAGGIGGGGGGGAGAPSGAEAAAPTQATATPQRVIIEGIDRNSLISGEQLSNIFEALYKENENRGFVFEVAR